MQTLFFSAWGGAHYATIAFIPFGVIVIDGQFRLGDFLALLAEMPLGLLLGVLTLHALNRIAWLWGEAAHFLLGTMPKAQPAPPVVGG